MAVATGRIRLWFFILKFENLFIYATCDIFITVTHHERVQ